MSAFCLPPSHMLTEPSDPLSTSLVMTGKPNLAHCTGDLSNVPLWLATLAELCAASLTAVLRIRLAKYGLCLTTSDIYSSYCVMFTAMVSVPSGVKTHCSGMSSCCRAVSVRSPEMPSLTSPNAAVQGTQARLHIKAMLNEPPALKGLSCTMSTTSMAAPGPGGGVLDRPAVLPGYDNK